MSLLSAVVGLLATTGASATSARTVPLTVSVTGSGVVRVTGGHVVACKQSCRQTFRIRAGSQITVGEAATGGWKFASWAGACKGSAPVCKLRPRTAVNVSLTFTPPGARQNPYLEGQVARLDGGWQVTLGAAIFNADDMVAAVKDGSGQPANRPPPPGAQYVLVGATFKYLGGGSSNLGDYLSMQEIDAEGVKNGRYRAGACVPPPTDLILVGDVFSGQRVTGWFCYAIASNDVTALMLSTYEESGGGRTVWFATR